MRWVVKLGETRNGSVYLPRQHHLSAWKLKLPVTIPYAAMFRTRKSAQTAVRAAARKGFPVGDPIYEKEYPKSFRPKRS